MRQTFIGMGFQAADRCPSSIKCRQLAWGTWTCQEQRCISHLRNLKQNISDFTWFNPEAPQFDLIIHPSQVFQLPFSIPPSQVTRAVNPTPLFMHQEAGLRQLLPIQITPCNTRSGQTYFCCRPHWNLITCLIPQVDSNMIQGQTNWKRRFILCLQLISRGTDCGFGWTIDIEHINVSWNKWFQGGWKQISTRDHPFQHWQLIQRKLFQIGRNGIEVCNFMMLKERLNQMWFKQFLFCRNVQTCTRNERQSDLFQWCIKMQRWKLQNPIIGIQSIRFPLAGHHRTNTFMFNENALGSSCWTRSIDAISKIGWCRIGNVNSRKMIIIWSQKISYASFINDMLCGTIFQNEANPFCREVQIQWKVCGTGFPNR